MPPVTRVVARRMVTRRMVARRMLARRMVATRIQDLVATKMVRSEPWYVIRHIRHGPRQTLAATRMVATRMVATRMVVVRASQNQSDVPAIQSS